MHEKRAILTRELAGSTQPDQAPAAGRGEGAEGIGKFEFWKVSVFFFAIFFVLKKNHIWYLYHGNTIYVVFCFFVGGDPTAEQSKTAPRCRQEIDNGPWFTYLMLFTK